jgi:hypothetical protein
MALEAGVDTARIAATAADPTVASSPAAPAVVAGGGDQAETLSFRAEPFWKSVAHT